MINVGLGMRGEHITNQNPEIFNKSIESYIASIP